MGLSFPSGAEMESLALAYADKIPKRKLSIDGMKVNLSGLENMAKKMYDDTGDKGLVSRFVFDYIGRVLVSLSEAYEEQYGKSSFVYAGGVMSNSIIKNMLAERFSANFAEPRMSSDNAVGIAELTRRAYMKEKGCD
jgi:N6-L-threonylcarbamoyladenine synthase